MGNQLSITCTGVTNSGLSANPATFASLGEIQTATTGTGATITPGTTFSIRITQTVPSGGTPIILSGTLSGVVGPNSSTGAIGFTVTLGHQRRHTVRSVDPAAVLSRRNNNV